ncbi:MAG: helix-turn-helix transcriptional regulator [Lachnospiraceae bacterium]|nr:helix-turn-helix transcriptional regulator [Lachnospiraceae bacterium]
MTEQQECESAKELLEQVREQLDDDEEYKDLLGEWNLLMARMNFFDPDQAISYLQKARDMIDGRSKIVPFGTGFSMDVYGPFFTFLRTPGTADETGEKLEHMMELYDSLCGGTSRYDQLYQAQLAYYRGEFEKAKSLFLKAEGSAKKSGNLLDQICVAEYKTRIAFHMRDPVTWNQAFDFICGMQSHENRVLREIAACMKSQIRMSIGLLAGVPRWIRCGKFGAISEGKHYRMVEDRVSHSVFPIAWITYMEYLLYAGDFYSVINGADIAASLYGLNWMTLYDCYLNIYKASAWNALGNQERTVEYLREAVKILAPDGLWLFGAEFFPTLGENLLTELEPFGLSTLEEYRKFSKEYLGKLAIMRKMMTESVFREPLTEKEQTVARLAALGLKNEEIGGQLSISRNTVKYHLANVYKKLEISNRLELKEAMEAHKEYEFAYWTKIHEKEIS